MLKDLVLLFISFLVLWIGAGFSVGGVEKVARYVKISSFLVSYFALGFLTSVSEISVAYFSIVDKTPGISVGNLIGGSAVITLLIIPLLAVLNKGIKFDEKSEPINFPLAYFVISLPVLLILDRTISMVDAFIMIASVIFLAITISAKNTLLSKLEDMINHRNINVVKESLKVVLGVILIILSCKYIVDTTVLYANKYSIAPFLVGLILLSIGTNLPELTILIRSTIFKKKTIALGDYVGSAALNTITLGFLTVFNRAPIQITGGLKYNLLLLPLGAIMFLLFTKNKNLERKEGFFLLALYFVFVVFEFFV
jgi:cation:H+ antiporter